jgi:hypothetical protein
MIEPEAGPAPEVIGTRAEMANVNPGSAAHRAHGERLESFYRARYGEPAVAPPPADSPTSEDIAAQLAAIGDHPPSPEAAATSAFPDFTAPSGQTLDVDAVVALRGMELSHDVPVAELTAPTNEYKAAWERRGG